jgi:hypothetical protein
LQVPMTQLQVRDPRFGLLAAGDVLARVKQALAIEADRDLAVFIGVTPDAVEEWRQRNQVPFDAIVSTCLITGASLTYLLRGEGTVTCQLPASPLSPEVLEGVLHRLMRDGYIRDSAHQPEPQARVRSLAWDIWRYARHASNVLQQLVISFGVDEGAAYLLVFGQEKPHERPE